MSEIAAQEPEQVEEAKPLVRYTMYIKRHPKMDSGKFHVYWSTKHAPLVKEWLQKHGIVKYTQYHTFSADEVNDSSAMPSSPLSFDGHAELLMPSFNCYQAAKEDPYYEDTVRPDEEKIMDVKECKVSMGWEEVYVAEARVLQVKEGMTNEVIG